ncbi:MAG TPA: AMP-binding protein [Gaiellaceae bacterium]
MRLRKESNERPVEKTRHEPAPEFANLTVDLLKPVQHSKRYAITNVDSLGVIERFTYTEITRETARWAQLLSEKGLQPGDRVVIVAGREWGWRCALLGAIHAGGVAVPCPASLSPREIGTVAEHAGASLLISLRPRPDLVELDGREVLTADDVDAVDPARALEQPPYRTDPRDIALILYAWHDLDLTGTMHTHSSLLAQAEAAEHWLGLDEDERIWATVDDGSGPSIWLLLAAWRRAASIVVVDLELDSEAKLELLDRLRPAAVWFSDDEYGMLGSSEVPAWVDLRSIRRALVDTEETEGASSFVAAFGAALVPVFALDELGVVAGWPAGHEGHADPTTAHPTPGVQVAVVGGDGTELAPGEVGDVAVRSDAPTLFTGYAGREGRSRSAGWFRFGWRGALTAEGALRIEERSPSEVEPVGASVDLPVPEVAEEPAPEEQAAAPEPAAIGWRARRSAERARREEEHAAEEERRRREEAEAGESAEREAAQAAERERAEAAERRERDEAEARELAEREAAEERLAEERRERDEAEARERAEREAAAEAQRVEEERLAEERRVAEQQQQRDAEQRQRVEEEARRQAEQEEKQRAAAEADERRRAEAGAKQRAEEEKEAREREAREAKDREKAEADERRRAEEEAKAQQAAAAAEAKQRAEEEKSREKERQREEKEVRARAEREAKEREKADAEERRRAAEEAKVQAKREEAEAKQRAKDEKEREQREAKERAQREKAEAEAAKVQAKIDAAEAKQRAKQDKEREKREAEERVEREKAAAEAAKVQAKIDAAEAKQRAKDDKEREKREAAERVEREKREAVERVEREKAEAQAAKAREKQAEVDAKKRAEEEKRSAKEREREAKEARRRAEAEGKEAARAERKAARTEKRRPLEAPKPADDGQRRFGRRRREFVEEPEPQHAPDVVARIKQYGMTAESNGPAEPPEQADDE